MFCNIYLVIFYQLRLAINLVTRNYFEIVFKSTIAHNFYLFSVCTFNVSRIRFIRMPKSIIYQVGFIYFLNKTRLKAIIHNRTFFLQTYPWLTPRAEHLYCCSITGMHEYAPTAHPLDYEPHKTVEFISKRVFVPCIFLSLIAYIYFIRAQNPFPILFISTYLLVYLSITLIHLPY